MTKDLTLGQEKPLWPLTSYGPVKCQPMLIGGVDESFEELRVLAVAALKSGAINDYVCLVHLAPTMLNKSPALLDQI